MVLLSAGLSFIISYLPFSHDLVRSKAPLHSIVVMFFTHTYFRSQKEGDISSVELILIQLVFVLSIIFRILPIHFWFPPYNSKSTRFSASPVIKQILELPHMGTMAYRKNYIWHQLRKPKTVDWDPAPQPTVFKKRPQEV